jgi:hypothetical protein
VRKWLKLLDTRRSHREEQKQVKNCYLQEFGPYSLRPITVIHNMKKMKLKQSC